MAARPGKYDELTCRLDGLDVSEEWEATFPEIEELLGFPLPNSAKTHQAWWANQPKGQSQAWLRAGCVASNVDVTKGRVNFTRVSLEPYDPTRLRKLLRRSLTIDEAKRGLAETYNVDPAQIEITIKW